MSGSKGRDTRRNDGFRVADARQVRIEALEKSVKVLRAERDAARNDVERAQREVRALCAANDGLAKQCAEARRILAATQNLLAEAKQGSNARMRALIETSDELRRARAERVTWWDRLFGMKA